MARAKQAFEKVEHPPIVRPPASRSYIRTIPGWPMGSYYDGTPGKQLVQCPDCGQPADAEFGNHHGACERPSLRAQRAARVGR